MDYGWPNSTFGGDGKSKAADGAVIAGAPLTLMGTLMFVSSPFGGSTDYERVPLESTQSDTWQECVDGTYAAKGSAAWTLKHGGAQVSGTTGESGAHAGARDADPPGHGCGDR